MRCHFKSFDKREFWLPIEIFLDLFMFKLNKPVSFKLISFFTKILFFTPMISANPKTTSFTVTWPLAGPKFHYPL